MTATLTSTMPETAQGKDRCQQCLWYAWGRFDQAGIDSPADMFDWSRQMGRDTDAYQRQQRTFLPSIMDMFHDKWPEMKR